MLRSFRPLFVVEVDVQYRIGDFADRDIPHEHIFDRAAPHSIGLEAKGLVQVRAVHHAALGEDIAHASRHSTADGHATMTVLHTAIADHDVLGWARQAPAVAIASGFDRDAVVAGIKDAVLDQHVDARVGIATVVVGPVACNLDVPYR